MRSAKEVRDRMVHSGMGSYARQRAGSRARTLEQDGKRAHPKFATTAPPRLLRQRSRRPRRFSEI